ncbi:hypothetical protein HY415_01050 [Candidatus Kaiserbacteria bacterium]|nr:hypothetical protein [Candidatus Kaiserbacteria bacterium]
MNENLKKEFEFFKRNQDKLVAEHEGKYVVINSESVVGVYDSELEAYHEAQKGHTLGTFIIQHCVPGTEEYTKTFHSRVTFSR